MNTIEKLEAILKRIADPQPTFAGPQCCLGTFEDTCELLAGEAAEALSLLSQVREEVAAANARAEAAEARVGELEYMRPEVLAFARRMENALRRKDGERGGNSWQKHTLPEEILPHLQERTERIEGYLKEVRKYRRRHDDMMEQMEMDNAAKEAVHAANFAMMIADICDPLARNLKGAPDGR